MLLLKVQSEVSAGAAASSEGRLNWEGSTSSALTRSPAGLSFSWAVGLRDTVLLWLWLETLLCSCRLSLSVGQLTTWRVALLGASEHLRKSKKAKWKSPSLCILTFEKTPLTFVIVCSLELSHWGQLTAKVWVPGGEGHWHHLRGCLPQTPCRL